MKNYIVIKDKETKQFIDIEDIMKYLLGSEYYKLFDEEKLIRRYEEAFRYNMFLNEKVNIVHSELGVFEDNYKIKKKMYDIKKDFFIDNDITYLLSLCRFNEFLLLEKISCKGIVIQELNIDNDNEKDNYIILNKYLDKLLVCHLLQKI